MKTFVVTTIARQVEGDIISVKFHKGFTTLSKAEEFGKTLPRVSKEVINTQQGAVEFFCETGIQEIEVEE